MRSFQIVFFGLFVLSVACTDEHVTVGSSSSGRSRTLFGASASSSSSSSSSGATNSTASTAGTPTPLALSSQSNQCTSLLDSAPRGLACLHCTQPEARSQARQIRSTLLGSCLKNVAINYLVDGTFSFDHAFLLDEITELTSGGRKLFISFYLSNGPAQRRYDTTDIDSFGTHIAPEDFRYRIQHDPILQGEYQSIVDRLVPILRYARQRGASVAVIPMLEDNLSDRAFDAMLELTLAVIPPSISISVGRNPCPGCYDGNGSRIPDGVFEELHTDWRGIGIQNGIVSNDGRNYSSPASGIPLDADTTLDELRAVRDAAGNANNIFILWNAARQGLPTTSGEFPVPSSRFYAPISSQERSELLSFLRE